MAEFNNDPFINVLQQIIVETRINTSVSHLFKYYQPTETIAVQFGDLQNHAMDVTNIRTTMHN